jgi:hypothetical protein
MFCVLQKATEQKRRRGMRDEKKEDDIKGRCSDSIQFSLQLEVGVSTTLLKFEIQQNDSANKFISENFI